MQDQHREAAGRDSGKRPESSVDVSRHKVTALDGTTELGRADHCIASESHHGLGKCLNVTSFDVRAGHSRASHGADRTERQSSLSGWIDIPVSISGDVSGSIDSTKTLAAIPENVRSDAKTLRRNAGPPRSPTPIRGVFIG